MFIMLKYIILFGFVDLSSVIPESNNRILSYKIPRKVFEKFVNEFEKFKGHSDIAKEFEERHFNLIKNHILTTSDDVDKLIELIKSAQEFCESNSQWKVLERKWGGHIYEDKLDPSGWAMGYSSQWFDEIKAEVKKKCEEDRLKYIGKSDISFVGEGVVIPHSNEVEHMAESLGGGLGGFAAMVGMGTVVGGPIGGIVGVGMFVGGFTGGSTLAIRRAQDISWKFDYVHKSECLENCDKILTEYTLYSVEELVGLLLAMRCIVDYTIDVEDKLSKLNDYVEKIKEDLAQSQSNLIDIGKKFEEAFMIINELENFVEYNDLSDEMKQKFEELKRSLNNMNNRLC